MDALSANGKKICDLVDSGIIGTPRLLLANKGELDLNGFAPELAGSTLLGLGVYAINDAFLVLVITMKMLHQQLFSKRMV